MSKDYFKGIIKHLHCLSF